MEEAVEILEETGRWRARDVTYSAGKLPQIIKIIPLFTADDYRVSDGTPPNPYLKSIVRQPLNKLEQPMPIAVVSKTYTLAQHQDVARQCINGIEKAGIETDSLRGELGLSEFGEWMNLRIYFPSEYNHTPDDGEPLGLRLECFNSVDGSSRLIVLLGWLRFVCSNGMVIGETRTEFRDIHNQQMNLSRIPGVIAHALQLVNDDLEKFTRWESVATDPQRLEEWVNNELTKSWGKKAACRVFYICKTGSDSAISDPFASGDASQKPVRRLDRVPGAKTLADNLYDVAQALSWVATQRNSSEEKLAWQSQVPHLLNNLSRPSRASAQ